MRILGLIPARGGSKCIPRKNIVELGGKPLLAYTAEAALRSEIIDRAVLSSDDDQIMEIGKKLGLEIPFKRPKDIAKDDTPSLPVIQHAIEFLESSGWCPDLIIVLQPTSPLRNSKHIDESIKTFMSTNADSLVSVMECPHIFSPYSVMKLKNGFLMPFIPKQEDNYQRQKKPRFFARNGAAIYIANYQLLMKDNRLLGPNLIPFVMDKISSIDIDDADDLFLAESVLSHRQ